MQVQEHVYNHIYCSLLLSYSTYTGLFCTLPEGNVVELGHFAKDNNDKAVLLNSGLLDHIFCMFETFL